MSLGVVEVVIFFIDNFFAGRSSVDTFIGGYIHWTTLSHVHLVFLVNRE
jgi:hypothetical protein